ncbi:hypothetical protein AAMO2058_001347500 [Amorphochlora amoebiformis]
MVSVVPDSTSVEGPSEDSDVEKESDDQFILRYTSEQKDASKFLANCILSIFDRLGPPRTSSASSLQFLRELMAPLSSVTPKSSGRSHNRYAQHQEPEVQRELTELARKL